MTIKTIYLIGFMGSGKSTVGYQLAKQLGKSYIDTDQLIEKKYEQKIANIFKIHGEDVFRMYEMECLGQASAYQIVSTGGGIVERQKNLQTMNDHGIIVYLQTSFDVIAQRIDKDQTRPLWNKDSRETRDLFNNRTDMYEAFADYTIQTDDKSVDAIVKEVIQILAIGEIDSFNT
ncbi:MAG TPA: shikimate kinase [Virgibacillus sp.]|nr:shikimate kinase [Virgibacillus sp.]